MHGTRVTGGLVTRLRSFINQTVTQQLLPFPPYLGSLHLLLTCPSIVPHTIQSSFGHHVSSAAERL